MLCLSQSRPWRGGFGEESSSRGGPRNPLRDRQAPWFLSECRRGLPFSDADFGNPRVIFLDEGDRRELRGFLSAGVSLPLMGHGLSQPLELNPR